MGKKSPDTQSSDTHPDCFLDQQQQQQQHEQRRQQRQSSDVVDRNSADRFAYAIVRLAPCVLPASSVWLLRLFFSSASRSRERESCTRLLLMCLITLEGECCWIHATAPACMQQWWRGSKCTNKLFQAKELKRRRRLQDSE